MRFMPSSRGGVLWRALVAAVLVVGFAAAATTVTGLLQVKNIVDEFQRDTQHIADVTLPKPGAPETILIIGSDHRAHTSYESANTDTMLLVRLNDSSSTVNLMSVPRDLEVNGADGAPIKLNGIYATENGPDGLIRALKQQVFGPTFAVNHVIDLNFVGFSDLVDSIGCVYSAIDRRYYNVSAPAPSPDNFSSIDIQPGYQKLCGGGYSNSGNGALAFVRYRHTDTDEVRNARQQDFIRWARDNYSTDQLASNEGSLLKVFAHHASVDSSFGSTNGLIDLFDLVLNANKLTLRSIQFPEYFGQNIPGQPDYVYPCPSLSTCSGYGGTAPTIGEPTPATEAIWSRFLTPTQAAPAPTQSVAAAEHRGQKVKRTVNTSGLVADVADGTDQAAALGDAGLPVYFPKFIDTGGNSGAQTYCFAATEDCDPTALEPASAYNRSYPRRYLINGTNGVPYKSYVMTLALNQNLGEFYTVQGTTWKDPPLLRKPSRIYRLNNKKLFEFDDGSRIATVALYTATGTYWIENTLNNAIPNAQMVTMAAEMTQYVPKH